MSRWKDVYNQLKQHKSLTADETSKLLNIDRSTASRYLNDLVRKHKAMKIPGKPVVYEFAENLGDDFVLAESEYFGVGQSLQPIIEQGLAAFLYPAKSLPILFTGETGTGKTFLAETLAKVAKGKMKTKQDLPFIVLNCADYAQNPELLVGQIFGIKEGAFTGATEDQMGLVEQAEGGVLFLDEIHRLPPSGQEMLFYLLDKGIYRRLGEATRTRKANVAIIGATTEDPSRVLLPTLVRRFSVKLHLPPLRERTTEEREKLIQYFLSEEALKMETKLAITDQCKQALLAYPCSGNIGQLKSDIQIACAHAYLRYLNNRDDQVLIQVEDLPEEVTVYVENSMENIQFQTVDQKLQQTKSETDMLPNIYKKLATITSDYQLDEMIETYIQDLLKKYHQPSTRKNGWQHLIDEDLLNALLRAKEKLGEHLPIDLDLNQLYVIGLHLQNYRKYQRKKVNLEALPKVIHPNVQLRETALQLANYLYTEIGMQLPDEEVELLAHFLTPKKERAKTDQTIAIILVTHGNSTATSMADVTNTLLGNDVIQPIDMPLHVSASAIYKKVKETIKQQHQIKGALLLVDIGSLITMGSTIQHELDVPVKTLSSVNLPMVLEAGRKSLMPDLSLDELYTAAKRAMTLFLDKDKEERSVAKKRLIATVCFTGEGAAQLLENWIENQLTSLDQDVLIRTVRIDPATKDTTVLNDLNQYYDVIAIIGTVPVSINGVPYIPAWELLQQDGIARLTKLLEVTRQVDVVPDKSMTIAKDEISPLVTKGLAEIVLYVNPKTITTLLNQYIPPIRNFYQWETDRELGMWMHIGSLIDRIIGASIKQVDQKLVSSIPLDGKVVITQREQMIWDPFFNALENTFQLELPESIKIELIKLSR